MRMSRLAPRTRLVPVFLGANTRRQYFYRDTVRERRADGDGGRCGDERKN